MKKLSFAAVSVAALTFAVALATQEATVLKLNVASGTEHSLKSKTTTSFSMAGMMEQSSTTSETSTSIWKFGTAADGWTKFTVNTKDVKVEMEGEGFGGGSPDDFAKARESTVVSGEANGRGATRNVVLSGGNASDPITQMAIGGVELTFKELGLQGVIFPEGGVKVGDSWTQKLSVGQLMSDSSGGMLSSTDKAELTFKFEGIEEKDGVKMAKVSTKGNSNLKASSAMGGDATITYVVNNVTYFDLATGLTLSSKGETETSIDMGVVQVQVVISSTLGK